MSAAPPPLVARADPGGLAVDGPPPARCGRWRVWLRGAPEGHGHLAAAHGLGAPGSLPADQVLAAMLDRVGPDRALPQLEGHWHALLSDGESAWAISARMGTGAWFWSEAGAGVTLSDHPAALARPADADPAALRRLVAGAPRGAGETVWTTVRRVEAGHCLRVAAGVARPQSAWWPIAAPPAGRAGHRGVWDRAVRQALVLGVARATRAGPWTHAAAHLPGDAALLSWAPAPPAASTLAAGPPPAVALAALPEPRLSLEARALAGAVHAAPGARPVVVAAGAPALLGAHHGRAAAPTDWLAHVQRILPVETVAPLQALAGARPLLPALLHPAAVQVVAQVPWRHLRGLRGTLAHRLGLAPVTDEPWAAWLEGEGRSWVAAAGLGPLPDTPGAAARAAIVAAWRG